MTIVDHDHILLAELLITHAAAVTTIQQMKSCGDLYVNSWLTIIHVRLQF